jgi:GNAT superfamily N-acetyltransferase
MKVDNELVGARGIRFAVEQEGREVAHAYLYLLSNDLHAVPFGLMEDLFVDDSLRGQGIGTELVDAVIAAARDARCYKLIATSRDSRPLVHALYRRRGFFEHGREFRIDF